MHYRVTTRWRITLSNLAKAVCWMMGTLMSFLLMAIAGRELSAEIAIFQILLFRNTLCLLILLAIIIPIGFSVLRTSKPGWHLFRNTVHFGAQYGWFYGIAFLPLAEVFAIEFTTPIWTAILASLFLAERLTRIRVISILLGFLGILLILRPGVEIINPASFAVLGAAIGYATTYTITKRLVSTEAPIVILFYMNLVQLPLSIWFTYGEWILPSQALWPWVLVVGITGLTSHYCLSRALVLADASLVVPMDFLRLPLAAIIAYLIYAEPLNQFVLIGAVIIFTGNYLNITAKPKPATQ